MKKYIKKIFIFNQYLNTFCDPINKEVPEMLKKKKKKKKHSLKRRRNYNHSIYEDTVPGQKHKKNDFKERARCWPAAIPLVPRAPFSFILNSEFYMMVHLSLRVRESQTKKLWLVQSRVDKISLLSV